MRNSTLNPLWGVGRALAPSPWGHLHAELICLCCHRWLGQWRQEDADKRHFRGGLHRVQRDQREKGVEERV